MNQQNEWHNAFGKADRQFEETVIKTLMELERKEERRIMKKTGIRIVIALACLVLMTTVALAAANSWGLMDFLTKRRSGSVILPEATALITKAPQQTQTVQVAPPDMTAEPASFAVRETVFDGQYVYVVVEVKPASPDTFLMGLDLLLDDPIGNLGSMYQGMSGTVREYAVSKGKENFLRVNIHEDSAVTGEEGVVNSMDYIMEEDGTLAMMLSGSYSGGAASIPLNLICTLTPYVDPNSGDTLDIDKQYKVDLSLTLTSVLPEESVQNVEPVEFADCGVRVDRITLTKSPMATYVKVEYTVIDEETYAATDDGLWFEFLDENGERLPDGAPTSGQSGAVADSDTQYMQESSIRAMNELPDKVTIRGYNCWEKNRYSTHTVKMK